MSDLKKMMADSERTTAALLKRQSDIDTLSSMQLDEQFRALGWAPLGMHLPAELRGRSTAGGRG